MDEMVEESRIVKSQIVKAEKGSPSERLTGASLKGFANFFDVDWETLIHPEDPYWESEQQLSKTAKHSQDIQDEGIFRSFPMTKEGRIEECSPNAISKKVPRSLQPSTDLLTALQTTINAAASPVGLLGHDERILLCNSALLDFYSEENLSGLTLNELGRSLTSHLEGNCVNLDKLHQSLRDKAADGPQEILKLIGDVDFRESPTGQWSQLYEMRLFVWPIWEHSSHVGSMFHYILSEKEAASSK